MNDYSQPNQTKERAYADALALALNGKREVRVPIGWIDVLTDWEVIEVKAVERWKEAVGQVILYGAYYPQYGKRIHLIGKPNESKRDLIEMACVRTSVRVTWVEPTSTLKDIALADIEPDITEASADGFPAYFTKIIELSRIKGWIKVRDVQRCYDSKHRSTPEVIRSWFVKLEEMEIGITRGVGRSMEFKYSKQ